MKNITYIFVFLLALTTFETVNAQNYNGVPILGTLESPDPDFACPTETGTQPMRLFRDAVPSSCPMKPCPGDFPGGMAWVSYQFQNLLGMPQCITVNHNVGTCVVPHGFAVLGEEYDPTKPMCANNDFLGDVGSSINQPYSFEVPASAIFVIVLEQVAAPSNCMVGFTIEGEVGCAGGGGETLKPLSGGTSVPTMTQWGLFLFGLIVLTLGVVYIYNMSISTSKVEE